MARRGDRMGPADFGRAAPEIPRIGAREWIEDMQARYRDLEAEAYYVLLKRRGVLRALILALRQWVRLDWRGSGS